MDSTWTSIWMLFSATMVCYSLPVDIGKTTLEPVKNKTAAEEWDTGLEYDRYLKEVVQVLENDPEFRKKMESANPEHFKTGEIAKELNFVSHNVRSKLDEIKRSELTRLRALMKEKMDRNEAHDVQLPKHVNALEDSFNEEDLKRLIQQTTSDLQAADEARKKEFKEYEMDKEHQRREKLKAMDERSRKEEERKYEQEKKKHQDHPSVHHPGSKPQLEEVWEESDGLPAEQFEPKTFFRLHDLNQDGILDQGELEALFQKELDKIYDPNAPEDDMRERSEEMARMREHVMKEMDHNKDGMVSFEEWMIQVNRPDFQKDEGWDTIDKQPQFDENELREYERQLEMHNQNYQYPPQQQGYQQGGYQQGRAGGYNQGDSQGGYNQYPGGPPIQQGSGPGQYNQPPNSGYNPGATQAPYGSQGNPTGYQQQRNQQQYNQGGQQQYNQGNQNQGYNQGNQNQPNYNQGGNQQQNYNQGNQNPQGYNQPTYNQGGNQNQQQKNQNQGQQQNQGFSNQGNQNQAPPQSSQWNNNPSAAPSQPSGATTYDPRNDPNSINSAKVVGGQHH